VLFMLTIKGEWALSMITDKTSNRCNNIELLIKSIN